MNKIFLVEDEAVIAMSISDKLEEKGFEVVGVAKDYVSSLKLIETSNPNLVLLDINIQGDKDGIQIGEKLNQDFKIPFIYLTSYSNKSIIEAAKKTNPLNYLFKNSYNEDQFMLTIELALESNNNYAQKNRKFQKLEKIVDNNSNFIIAVDENGKILYSNKASIRFLGKKPEELYEDSSFNFSEFSFFNEMMSKVLDKKRKSHRETTFPTIMGERYVSISATPELSIDKKVDSVIFEIQDITDQKLAVSDMLDKHKKISESINYSKNIQDVLFPKLTSFDKYFSDSFMINKPRDVIGGDFPFVMKVKNEIFIALIDCTGHGVPGALMSLIIHFLLSNILKTEKNLDTGHILDTLHASVIETLKQHFQDSQLRDGADMALLKFDDKRNKLNFSSAYRPLFIVNPQGELQEIKGDKFPIGGGDYKNRKNYNTQLLDVEKGSRVLIFSDGVIDQFDQSGDFKYGYKPLRQILRKSTDESMNNISGLIEKDLMNWKGFSEQTDDILIIGVEI